MKKSIILLALAVALVISCNQKPKSYVLTGQLYGRPSPGFSIEKVWGNVKSIKITNYVAEEENGKYVKGRELTAEDRSKFNNMEPAFMEEYNPSGVAIKSVSYSEKGKELSSCIAECTGKMMNKQTYYTSDTISAYGITSNNGDFLEEVKYYNPVNDTLYMRIEYEYDEDGKRIKQQGYNYKGEPGGYRLFKYNDNGFVIQVLSYNAAGNLYSQNDFTLSDKGDRLTSRNESFGANARVVNYKFEREYDRMGNWIKALMYFDGEPLIIRERQIEYYD